MDHLQTINQILEKVQEYNLNLHLALIDFSKAFDSGEHKPTFKALQTQGVPAIYIRILKKLYKNSTAKIKTDIEEVILIEKGVKQGDPLSPKIFTCLLEDVFRKLKWENEGLQINGRRLNNLKFADDIIVLATSQQKLPKMLDELNKESRKVGLHLNLSKTKVMTNHKEIPIKIEGKQIDYVQEYIYLVKLISFNKRLNQEIDRRITVTWQKFWNLSVILLDKHIGLKIKREVIDSCTVIPRHSRIRYSRVPNIGD